jgi:xanthine dehydrogenase accessory factor
MGHRMQARADELRRQHIGFVHATVVRAESPTSAFTGDDAVILADGTIEGFVGGQCAEESVRTAAMEVLAGGESLLLRIVKEGGEVFPDVAGSKAVINPCLSGGALEIFLEPQLPVPIVSVVGTTPTAVALASLASAVGLEATTSENLAGSALEGVTAVVVASHGHHEEESIRAALDAGVPYIGLVASKKRGGAVIDVMDLSEDDLARVHSPVGIEIGARSAEEIALSILADVVRAIRIDAIAPSTSGQPLPARTAVDPICGMTVVVGAGTAHAVVDGQDYWFCCPGCRDKFVA